MLNEQIKAGVRSLPKLGPNMRRLAAEAAKTRTLTAGGGPLGGIERYNSGEHIIDDLIYGIGFARVAVDAVRKAEDPNPYRALDDEAIAAEILEQISARRAQFAEHNRIKPQVENRIKPQFSSTFVSPF